MSQEKCSHKGCGRDTNRSVSKDGKCIFHCEKDDWFTTNAKGEQDWCKGGEKVKAFWAAFSEEWADKKNSDFSWFVFPNFTHDAEFIKNRGHRQLNGREVHEALSFGNTRFLGLASFPGFTFNQSVYFSYATFEQDASFENADFTHDADFRGGHLYAECRFPPGILQPGCLFRGGHFHAGGEF